MYIKSDILYICLMLHCFIYHDGATSESSNKHEDPTRKRSRKWTSDEEKNLIYFDVLTDTGKPKHFDRIRDMWRRMYAQSDVTDVALRGKLLRLRKESQEEGEYKSNFNWNEHLKQELLDVYHNTRPYRKNAGITLEEEWKRRHSDYHARKATLQDYARKLSKERMFRRYIPQDAESERSYRHQWTEEWTNELRSLIKSTETGERYPFQRIKSEWYKKYPNSNVTNSALKNQYIRLRRVLKKKEECKVPFKWDEKSERELLELYFNTYPHKTDVNMTLEEEWKRRHQDHQAIGKTLVNRARKLIRTNKYPEYRESESSTTNIQWDNQHDSELMHIYNIALPRGGPYLRRTQQLWSKLHPQYEHVTLEQLKERLNHLKRKPPTGNFPWTKKEDEELLDIYDETMPDKEDQGRRIYDIWTQRHPRYKFMTPYYLQVHASTLARKREVEATGRKVPSGWTYEEKADLVNMANKYPREHRDELYAFHEEWVHKHPRLAYKTNSDLYNSAKRFKKSGSTPRLLKMEEGSSSRVTESSPYTPKSSETRPEKQKRELFHNFLPRTHEHESQVEVKSDKKHEDSSPLETQSPKQLYKKWGERGPDKRADKAPVVYSPDGSGPSSPPMMSERYD